MIERERLRDGMVDGIVVFDKWGNIVHREFEQSLTCPALVVDEVTDALKTVVGDEVGESVDRSRTWKVDTIALDSETVEKLPEGVLSVEELLDEVKALGLEWTVSLTSSP